MGTDSHNEVLERISRDFKVYQAAARKGSRYPVRLRMLIREAAKNGIEKEKLIEASGIPNQTLSKWLPRPKRRKEPEKIFTELQIVDSPAKSRVSGGSTVVFTYPSGVRLELGVDILSTEMLVNLGVLS